MTTLDSRPQADTSIKLIDARGPRFGAILTTLVLAVTLLTIPSTLSVVLLSLQTLVFALGSIAGLAAQPYGIAYRRFVQPKLGKPTDLEDPRPPRFAQSVGLVFAVVGLVALLTGATTVAFIAVGAALAAAFLNAAFNFCLGCEMYLIGRRMFDRSGVSA
jgi:hypothetical protein